jgi:hypothetical protein
MRKLAELFLAVVSTLYIILGVSILIPGLNILAILMGFGGIMVGAVPAVAGASFGSGLCFGFAPCSQAQAQSFGLFIIGLGIAALILGVIALVSLAQINKNPKWVRLWYFLSGLSVLIIVSNLALVNFREIFEIICPLLICLATFEISRHQPTEQEPVQLSAQP